MKSFDLSKQLGIPELNGYLEEVQSSLLNTLPESRSVLYKPLKRIITAPSKRLRSALVIVAFGNNAEINSEVIAGCVAVELIHLASLIHDDIMDESNFRWGQDTINKKEGINLAILAGDYLFARANQIAVSISPQIAHSVAKTISQLCEGQALEGADVNNIDRSTGSYIKTIRGKTGSLLAESCFVGGSIAGLNDKFVSALADFGTNFGVSFQIIDDILDFVSSPELLGKPVGNDIVEGIYTLPVILALKGEHHKKMLACLQDARAIRSSATTLLIHEGYIRQATKVAERHNLLAKNSAMSAGYEVLANLPHAYSAWALNQLVA